MTKGNFGGHRFFKVSKTLTAKLHAIYHKVKLPLMEQGLATFKICTGIFSIWCDDSYRGSIMILGKKSLN